MRLSLFLYLWIYLALNGISNNEPLHSLSNVICTLVDNGRICLWAYVCAYVRPVRVEWKVPPCHSLAAIFFFLNTGLNGMGSIIIAGSGFVESPIGDNTNCIKGSLQTRLIYYFDKYIPVSKLHKLILSVYIYFVISSFSFSLITCLFKLHLSCSLP